MNIYRFIVDTDTIKSDNIFTIQSDSFDKARNEIIDITTRNDFTYLNIVLVYSDDKTVNCDYNRIFYAIRSDYESNS